MFEWMEKRFFQIQIKNMQIRLKKVSTERPRPDKKGFDLLKHSMGPLSRRHLTMECGNPFLKFDFHLAWHLSYYNVPQKSQISILKSRKSWPEYKTMLKSYISIVPSTKKKLFSIFHLDKFSRTAKRLWQKSLLVHF